MTPIQIVILVLSVLVMISFALYFVFERFYWKWYQTIYCYITQFFMFIGSIILIVATACKLSNRVYQSGLIIIYIADLFALSSIFVFAFWKNHPILPGIFNWAGLVSFLVMTPLIILVHVYFRQNPNNPYSGKTSPSNQTPLQCTYQQY